MIGGSQTFAHHCTILPYSPVFCPESTPVLSLNNHLHFVHSLSSRRGYYYCTVVLLHGNMYWTPPYLPPSSSSSSHDLTASISYSVHSSTATSLSAQEFLRMAHLFQVMFIYVFKYRLLLRVQIGNYLGPCSSSRALSSLGFAFHQVRGDTWLARLLRL